MLARTLVLAAVSCLSACAWFQADPPEYSRLELGSGVVVRDLVVPDEGAETRMGDTVAVHYDLFLSSELVESSRPTGQPLRIVLGTDAVPAGLQQGILGMRLFGRRRIEVPPELAYGETGKPPRIPPNATLIFELELMELIAAE